LKQELADVCIEFLKPIQERVRGIDDDKLDQILEQGAERAEAIARMTLSEAKAQWVDWAPQLRNGRRHSNAGEKEADEPPIRRRRLASPVRSRRSLRTTTAINLRSPWVISKDRSICCSI
jgi:hypothetical protein